MPAISRQEARELIDNREDLTVVEVLEKKHYRKFHLPRAQNVPLDDSFADNIRQVAPNLSDPVLVYCMDAECQASSKAVKQMEEIGYQNVYDYEAGKVDWKEAGLPIEEPSHSSV